SDRPGYRKSESGDRPGYRKSESSDRGGYRGDRSDDRGGYRKSDSGDRPGFRKDSSGDRGGYRGQGSGDRPGYRKDDSSGDRGGYRGGDRSSDRGGYRKDDSGDRGGYRKSESSDRGGHRGQGSGDRPGYRKSESSDRGGYRGDRSNDRSSDRGGYRKDDRRDSRPADRDSSRNDERPAYQRDDRRDERSRERAARFQERLTDQESTGEGASEATPEVTSGGERAGYRLGDGAAASRAASRGQVSGNEDGEDDVEGVKATDDAVAADVNTDADAGSDDEPSGGKPSDDAPSGDESGDADGPQAEQLDEAPAPRGGRPELPEEADLSLLDPEIKAELRSLPKGLAEIIGRHLAAAGLLIDEDPQLALEHARYARSKAARVGVVREAAGLTAYFADEWAEALSELRAARRMMTGPGHLAIMADCERALGRPERAIDLAKDPSAKELSQEDEIELRIVAAGARRDMGQFDAAVIALQGPDLDPGQRTPYSARLFYAYADNLAAAGRTEEAVKWFLNAAEADDEGETDAAERAFELTQEETPQQ
ncbi:hypothetical protein, partial [Lentzea sp.]|uniref:hypothetical protein n=1 Tax=Lentzea sp. TaxID=56099 RepID=UPI002B81D53E